ncbi:NAD(P)H-binding protein [Myroides guanonis]|uniref:NAD(P)H-binding n=1 Tax=Myroides guanonis TaxID=1150112 RepID=A0A1I3SJ66_9FLAO|nr:NAD(P)H-binding protein [Myroides guanonis]SFJ58480.1 NAD(P)H-binding [Myroides guanonis]
MKCLVIGATGATGYSLVQQLLEDDRFSEVVVFVRSEFPLENDKLKVHQVDFNNHDEWANLIQGDVAFSCLGTTLKQAGSKEKQWKVDYEYQYNFAKNASLNKVPVFVLVSAQGANSDSKMFYSRMKGELENAIDKLSFEKLVIMKPGLLKRPDSDRFGERLAEKMLNAFNSIGVFKSYKPLPVQVLASKMIEKAMSSEEDRIVVVSEFQN